MKTNLIVSCIAVLTLMQSCQKDYVQKTENALVSTSQEDLIDARLNDSSLLCYYPFNSNLKDKSGHNNHGALVGNISFVTDRFGRPSKAASFAASNTYIEVPEADFVGLTEMTVSMDFYATTSNRQLLFSKITHDIPYTSPDWNASLVLVIEQANADPIQFNTKKEGYCNSPWDWDWNTTINSNTNFELNKWNHIAVTFNDNEQKMYLNGVLVGSQPKVSSPVCQAEPLRLGVWWSQDPLYFEGYMDEVRIFNRVLTDKEIKRLSTK
ncbi:LamG domain-containing protein [Panacibacter sp. DH6]|uniref:LamG domain-containing protein n=1 Tax=Panacibacter microcysteis TaxID=2793269 RepID=A0A931H0I1_9BACT|nr:LamG domain-containing protein [Panacibacter microcysteis]MBG9378717.1 LamG domain-containing protein [Panacibacter microcysteis]